MQVKEYREALEDAVYMLHEAELETFSAMVNIGMSGEYVELAKLHEEGEEMKFEVAMFEDTGDTNLDIIIQALRDIAKAKNALINLNALQVDLEV